jgi:hypothetical protein
MSDPFVPDVDAAEQRREAVPAVEEQEAWEPPTRPVTEGSEGDVWEQSQPVADDEEDVR